MSASRMVFRRFMIVLDGRPWNARTFAGSSRSLRRRICPRETGPCRAGFSRRVLSRKAPLQVAAFPYPLSSQRRRIQVPNYLKTSKLQQVTALLELGWTYRRIEAETGVRRETISRYDRLRQAKPAKVFPGSGAQVDGPNGEFDGSDPAKAAKATAGSDSNPAKVFPGSSLPPRSSAALFLTDNEFRDVREEHRKIGFSQILAVVRQRFVKSRPFDRWANLGHQLPNLR